MIIAVDIDGTICKTKGNDYAHSVPLKGRIEKINMLYKKGHTIIYWTARGGTSGLNLFQLTLSQLNEWGCYFHELRMGKLSFDFLIDDKSGKFEHYKFFPNKMIDNDNH